MLRLQFFNCDDKINYNNHLRLKKMVFVDEIGWPIPNDINNNDIVERDYYDQFSEFVNANLGDAVVGTMRMTKLTLAFPHQDIFPEELVTLFENEKDSFWTMNGLAVLPKYRRGLQTSSGTKIYSSDYIMKNSIEYVAKKQGKIVWTTASSKKVGRFLEKFGFMAIGAPWIDPTTKIEFCNYKLAIELC